MRSDITETLAQNAVDPFEREFVTFGKDEKQNSEDLIAHIIIIIIIDRDYYRQKQHYSTFIYCAM